MMKNDLQETFDNVVIPKVNEALDRGYKTYGNMWKKHIHTGDLLEDIKHLVDIHIKTRMLEGLIALDYQDVDTFEDKMASAIGYICNAVTKARYLQSLNEGVSGVGEAMGEVVETFNSEIAPCPNPECKAECEIWEENEGYYFVTCKKACGYNGPDAGSSLKATYLHNQIAGKQ